VSTGTSQSVNRFVGTLKATAFCACVLEIKHAFGLCETGSPSLETLEVLDSQFTGRSARMFS